MDFNRMMLNKYERFKMDQLEKLTQDEFGTLYRADGRVLAPVDVALKGKICTLVVANPCLDISSEINTLTERNSILIPKGANAYLASDFSGDTQHLRKSDLEGRKKFYCIFAVQFYYASPFSSVQYHKTRAT